MSAFKSEIIITDRFEAYHMWAEAPKEVNFLRNMHRHMFYVRLGIPVEHNDRAREFFLEKKVLAGVIKKIKKVLAANGTSCETIAQNILIHIPYAQWCEVWEDDENGAKVTRQ